jgi:hypothetical protein
MVLPGIPDGFPETAHSVHAQRSRVEETDRIPAADEGSRAHPPTPTAPAPRAPASDPPSPRHSQTSSIDGRAQIVSFGGGCCDWFCKFFSVVPCSFDRGGRGPPADARVPPVAMDFFFLIVYF